MEKQKTLFAITIIALIAISIVVILSSNINAPIINNQQKSHYVVDYLGRNVSVPENPERIVSLSGDLTEILYAIDVGDKIVGVDSYSTYPSEALNKTNVGTTGALNLETLVTLKPDLVLLWSYQAQAVPSIEKYNITVVVVDATSINDLMNTMKFIGSVCGKPAEANALVSNLQSRINAIQMKTANLSDSEKPRVYFEGVSALHSYNSSTYTNDMIGIAGGINIAANETIKYPTLTSEYIVMENPNVIIVTSSGASVDAIKSRSGWQTIDAIQSDHIYSINSKWISANPRIILGIEQVAKWLHPELFK
jgi:iron complex transport system substrate-binding protein